jgi:hypothetical protein
MARARYKKVGKEQWHIMTVHPIASWGISQPIVATSRFFRETSEVAIRN